MSICRECHTQLTHDDHSYYYNHALFDYSTPTGLARPSSHVMQMTVKRYSTPIIISSKQSLIEREI